MVERYSLKDYELNDVVFTGQELGRGAYATVLELNYQGLKCAGKKIYPKLYEEVSHDQQKSMLEKFQQECQILSSLRHPNIVQFLGVVFEQGNCFPILVAEFLPANLRSCLDKYGVLPDHCNYLILDDVATGLCYLHGYKPNPIVHRDLTANNILLTANMHAKISDLGVAKILGGNFPLSTCPGTEVYMPHDAKVSSPVYDTDIDSFSFGVLILHALSGQWPNPKQSEEERYTTMIDKINDKSHPLLKLAEQCLSKDRKMRPKAADILHFICEIPSHKQNKSVDSLAEHISNMSEQQQKERKICQLEAEKKHLLEEKRQLKAHTMQKQLNELQIEKSYLEKKVKMLQESLEMKQTTIKAKNDIISKLMDTFEKEKESAVNALKEEILQKREIIHSNEKMIGHLRDTISSDTTDKPHPLNMKYELVWREAAEIPFGMTAPQHVVMGSELYIGGGQTGDNEHRYTILRYSTETNTWTLLPPSSYMHFGLGKHGNRLITVGGSLSNDNESITGEVLQFNDEDQAWAKCIIPSMPVPRKRVCVVSYKSGIVTCGGIGSDGDISSAVEVFFEHEWHIVSSLPEPRAALRLAVLDDVAYFSGGYFPSLQFWYDAKNDCYSLELPQLLSKSEAEFKTLPLLPVINTPVISLFGTLLTIGGLDACNKTQQTYVNRVYIYSASRKEWLHIDDLPFSRSSMTVASINNDDIIVVGGWQKKERTKCVMIGKYCMSNSSSD